MGNSRTPTSSTTSSKGAVAGSTSASTSSKATAGSTSSPPSDLSHARPVRPDHLQDDHTAATIREGFFDHLKYTRARLPEVATRYDRFIALAETVRDHLTERWATTQSAYVQQDVKQAYYLSAEYLPGRALSNNLLNTGLLEAAREAFAELDVDLDELMELEPDAGLGNGGLGRLAACFLDSLATLGLPAMGYGIRYEFGIFTQELENGYQVERADEWLKHGTPWEILRPELSVEVRFYGHVERHHSAAGETIARWVGGSTVIGVPHDQPVAGYDTATVNTLRLWQARASEDLDLTHFNEGDYARSVVEKNDSEVISKVLYPNDQFAHGKELRLKQQYFFVACSISDLIRRYLRNHDDFDAFADKVTIQLNDTHPAIAVPELMRVLLDDHRLGWDRAWELTQKVFGYTNHTLLAEALEKWSVALLERLLPRHLEIIYEVNLRFLRQVEIRNPLDDALLSRLSLIEEGPERQVRMAHLAVIGSHSVNGVAALHTELLQRHVFAELAEMYPERFNNKTNGVTPRRWVRLCNPGLSELITSRIGEGWLTDLERLEELDGAATDPAFMDAFRQVKRDNKARLTAWARDHLSLTLDPDAIFDVQVKRLHEYKRQLLNALHIVALWLRAREDPASVGYPRVFLFGGKAAPGYYTAKLIIRLINGIAEVVNAESRRTGIRVLFVPNYRVSLAERIIPAADVSEQISTAGKEASGTGNMKFALNGALTIGTLDGANVEIRERVGAENFFLFGLTEEEVLARKAEGYRGREVYERDPTVREVLDLIRRGFFNPEAPDLMHDLVDGLLNEDPYLVLEDFGAYRQAQAEVATRYAEPSDWTRMAILNVARSGWFSSDRTIREYARDVWKIEPVKVEL